jgi:hypothetical protein
VKAVKGSVPEVAIFSAYDFPNVDYTFYSRFTTQTRFFVQSERTHVVHAMMSSWVKTSIMFLLTDVVYIKKGSFVNVTLEILSARRIAVTNFSLDGKNFSDKASSRQLYVYYKRIFAGVLTVGGGRVTHLHLSDTNETVYFNTLVHIPGQAYFDVPFNYSTVFRSRASGAFYSLSWLLHGVNATTPSCLTYSEEDLVEYTLKYETNSLLKLVQPFFPFRSQPMGLSKPICILLNL